MRHWAIVGAALPGLAVGVLADTGLEPEVSHWYSRAYLPTVGPVALRFRAPEQPATNLVRMPLPPPQPEPAITLPPPDEPVAKKTAPPPAAAPQTTNQPAPPPEPPVAPAVGDPMISPQMLLKYFNHSTNGPSSGIIAPMNFAPPADAKPASGSATYSTNPN